jgi:hypothetical protein
LIRGAGWVRCDVAVLASSIANEGSGILKSKVERGIHISHRHNQPQCQEASHGVGEWSVSLLRPRTHTLIINALHPHISQLRGIQCSK